MLHAFVGVASTYRHTHSSKRGTEFTNKIMSEQKLRSGDRRSRLPRLRDGMKYSYFPRLDVGVVLFLLPVFDCSNICFASLLAAAADAGRRHNDPKQSIGLW